MQDRLPSGMFGHKGQIEEGGIRQLLTVRGPGIPVGTLDSTLLSITDMLPTVADLAKVSLADGGVPHMPLDGISFVNLLQAGNNSAGATEGTFVRRNDELSTAEQRERMLFVLAPDCWDASAVPELDNNR